jgi:hypothetical protein
MGTQFLGDSVTAPPPALLARENTPLEDIFRWMGGFLRKLGVWRRAIPHFFMESGNWFFIDKTQVYKNWIVLFCFADFGIFFCA